MGGGAQRRRRVDSGGDGLDALLGEVEAQGVAESRAIGRQKCAHPPAPSRDEAGRRASAVPTPGVCSSPATPRFHLYGVAEVPWIPA
jgi:hypothetical protein